MVSRDVVLFGLSDFVMSVIGVALGALLALGSSILLESRRSRQQLLGAIEVVITELKEDEGRLADRKKLTLGDWEQSKETLSQLAVRKPLLWRSLAETYGRIYELQRRQEDGASPESPTTQTRARCPRRLTTRELADLSKDLAGYADERLPQRFWYAGWKRRRDREIVKRDRGSRLAASGCGPSPPS